MAKSHEQFEQEGDAIRHRYRQQYGGMPIARPPALGVTVHAEPEIVATGRFFLMLRDEHVPVEGVSSSGIATPLGELPKPLLVAGVGGFCSGLMEGLDLFKEQWERADTRAKQREALCQLLVTSCKGGIKAGLIDRIAWPLVDLVVDRLLMHCEGWHSCAKTLLANSKPVVGMLVGKVLLDTVCWSRGWTKKHPFGKQNLVMTAAGLGLAYVSAAALSGPASLFTAVVGGSFVTSYLHKLTTEWVVRDEWLHQAVWRSVKEFVFWFSSSGSGSAPGWEVPDDLDVPRPLICQITQTLFMEPVLLMDMPFERSYVTTWILMHGRHPLNPGLAVSIAELRPADELKEKAHEFAAQHQLRRSM